MDYAFIRTQQGDRWDLFAWYWFSNPFQIEDMIRVNPFIGISAFLVAGLPLYIPMEAPQVIALSTALGTQTS